MVRLPIGDEAPHWRTFTSPVHRARTHLAEVRSLVERAEAWSAAGHWVVGALSYEAAPAFDSAMQVPAAGARPLAWFAAFSHASGASAPAPGFAVGGGLAPTPWPIVRRSLASLSASRQGDTYQVNYTQRLRACSRATPGHYSMRSCPLSRPPTRRIPEPGPVCRLFRLTRAVRAPLRQPGADPAHGGNGCARK